MYIGHSPLAVVSSNVCEDELAELLVNRGANCTRLRFENQIHRQWSLNRDMRLLLICNYKVDKKNKQLINLQVENYPPYQSWQLDAHESRVEFEHSKLYLLFTFRHDERTSVNNRIDVREYIFWGTTVCFDYEGKFATIAKICCRRIRRNWGKLDLMYEKHCNVVIISIQYWKYSTSENKGVTAFAWHTSKPHFIGYLL